MLVVGVALASLAASATIAVAAPLWEVNSLAIPTAFQSTEVLGTDSYAIQLENIGDEPSSGPVTFIDHLPGGVTLAAAPNILGSTSGLNCPDNTGDSVITCVFTPIAPAETSFFNDGSAVTIHRITIPVAVASNVAGSVVNTVTVSGGGAPPATVSVSNPVNEGPVTAFGASFLSFHAIGALGEPFTQAGGHPYALTTHLQFNQEIESAGESGESIDAVAGNEPKTVVAELPLGLIGDPQATPQCPGRQFAESEGENDSNCPADTRVGVASINRPGFAPGYQLDNIVPPPGHAAEFGFHFAGVPVVFYGDAVHSSRGYVLRVTALVPQAGVSAASLTFFGDPAAAFGTGRAEVPFLSNPTNCEASEEARTLQLHIDSWAFPGTGEPFNGDFTDPNWTPASTALPPVEGCSALRFDPSLSLQPSSGAEGSTQADEPSGYTVDLRVPQTESVSELATPELKTATVTLPEGLSVSPSAANGLEGCSDSQIALDSNEPATCPQASQIGTVHVKTPLLSEPLEGQVFLGDPDCSPCSEADASEGRLLRLFIQIHSARYGVTVKLPGVTRADPQTGRLTAQFAENPQIPFSDLELHFNSGAHAPLANPQTCGNFTTSSDLSPWSAPQTPDALSQSSFSISGCGAGFAPSFGAGTASPAAGTYSPLSLTFSRQDREQDLAGITVHTPPGLLGRIAGVARCPEAQANLGTCGPESQIGTTSVSAGPGSNPYTITGGRVYFTGPYKGQPFGLSIVVPAVAGPFNLGNVVVRAAISVDPTTSALSVTSDPLPQIKDGVPFRLRTVNVQINRPNFTLNATNCATQAIAATITGEHPIASSEAPQTTTVSSPYAASGCAKLAFKPSFSASTQARTSKANGASLDVKVGYSPAQANIAKVKVDLPKQLPSRLTTLQKACLDSVFEANPAACPEASLVGTATAATPLLAQPLTGPAYLVSHGNAAFPDLEVVLQGEGIKLVLDGLTNIKKGITSSTFAALPDAPISSFDLVLPEGPHSILATDLPSAAKASMCGQSLLMPTEITGQNGIVVKQSTKIAVSGCKAAKPATRAQKLASALKACKKKHNKAKRSACEAQARKRYGPAPAAKHASRKSSHRKGSN